ncbi:hypothetical protein FDECE_1167 [Fusarium decemcellulare]|nr:hypothetical protein FDECE_1167 [Fusarium decemcellulare]
MASQDFSRYRRNVRYASFMLLLVTAIALVVVSLQYSMTGDSSSLVEVIFGAILYPYPIFVLFQIHGFHEHSQQPPMHTLMVLFDAILTTARWAALNTGDERPF